VRPLQPWRGVKAVELCRRVPGRYQDKQIACAAADKSAVLIHVQIPLEGEVGKDDAVTKASISRAFRNELVRQPLPSEVVLVVLGQKTAHTQLTIRATSSACEW